MDDSYYVNHMAVGNNSLIVINPHSCRNCKVDVYCYSNSTSPNVGYYMFPNGGRVYNDYSHYYYAISRLSYSGVRIYNYNYSTPNIRGIFTCEIPDSKGNTIETSIGIYSSMPGMHLLHIATMYKTCKCRHLKEI